MKRRLLLTASAIGPEAGPWFGAKPVEGFELFAEAADLPAQLSKADLVITGEGRVDASSVMGKAAGSLARMCRERGIPCIALAGVDETTL